MDTRISGPSAVLFDLDGTIIDSRAGIIGSLHAVLRDLGHEPDLTHDLTWVVGPPLRDLVGELLHRYGDDRVEEALRLYRQHYEHGGGMLRTPLFDGMTEVLDRVAALGAKLFIATSKPVHLARAILDRHGLTSRFTAIYGATPDDGNAEKPELIAALLREQGVRPHQAVMIGDRRFDISGAHANGVRALGVLWGYGGAEELLAAGPEALAEVPEDLPALVALHLREAALHPHH